MLSQEEGRGQPTSSRGRARPHPQTTPLPPAPPAGDWVGVILNRIDRTISFTKRGYDLGVAFEGVTEEQLFPSVGFRTPDEEVRRLPVGVALGWWWWWR